MVREKVEKGERERGLGWRVQIALKRMFDVAFSTFFLFAFSPLYFVIALLIWLTMGRPILFRQPRLGHQGRLFVIYKFRTMTHGWDEQGNLLPDEQRLTRLGRFLRSTTLDELPELINVLKGEMSLVGPRPLLVEYRDLYTPEQWRRHEMPPGMAGPVLAAGRPTVLAIDGVIRKVIEDAHGGTFVQPGDPAALAAAVFTYYQDPDLRHRHGHNARSYVATHFDRQQQVLKLETTFERVYREKRMDRRIALALKRAFDVVVSFIALTLLLPLIGLIALTIDPTRHLMSGMPSREEG